MVPLDGQNEESDYVHASFLDVCFVRYLDTFSHVRRVQGYNESQLFIVAENPLFSTTGNFWRMVVQHKCAILVMLSDCSEHGEVSNWVALSTNPPLSAVQEVCYPYWPASVNTERYFGKIRVKSIGDRTSSDMNEHTISVSDTTDPVSCETRGTQC